MVKRVTYVCPNEHDVYHPYCRVLKSSCIVLCSLEDEEIQYLIETMFFKEKQGQMARYRNRIKIRCLCVIGKHVPKIPQNLVNRMLFLDGVLDNNCISPTCCFITPSDCCHFGVLEKLTQKKVAM